MFCSGANYKKHVIELIVDEGGGPMTETIPTEERRAWAVKMMDERAATGFPYMFSKPVSVVTGAYDNIVLPPHAKAPDWELELAVVIGRKARHVSRVEALSYVAGYSIVNDITNRDHVFRRDAVKAMGTDWIAAKGSPTYLPFGPYLVPAIAAYGQTPTATLSGSVRDEQGAVIAGAAVTVKNSETGKTRNVSTGVEGRYSFTNLEPGSYELRVEARGAQDFAARRTDTDGRRRGCQRCRYERRRGNGDRDGRGAGTTDRAEQG